MNDETTLREAIEMQISAKEVEILKLRDELAGLSEAMLTTTFLEISTKVKLWFGKEV